MRAINLLVMSTSCLIIAMDKDNNVIPYKQPVTMQDCIAQTRLVRVLKTVRPVEHQETIGSNLQRGGNLVAVSKDGIILTASRLAEIKKANLPSNDEKQSKSDICRQIEMSAENKRRLKEQYKKLHFDSYFSRHDKPSKL